MPGTMIPRGNIVAGVLVSVVLTPAAVISQAATEQSFTVAGLQTTDLVIGGTNIAQTAGIGLGNARVSALNTLGLTFENNTTGSLTPTAGAYLFYVVRPEFSPLPSNAT